MERQVKQNVAPVGPKAETHEGGRADAFQKTLEELTRAVSACLLFENTFYESGTGIAERIADLCGQVAPEDVSKLAIRARHDLKLRHVPLWLCAQLAKRHRGRLVSDTIQAVIRRPDEMGELIALYTGKKERGKPAHLNRSLRKGIARAYPRFDAYQLGKWNRDAAVTLRDVMFLCHPKPKDEAQAAVWKALIDKTLPAPDTWEVALSSGADKQATWTRLLTPDETGRRKLPYMARLMNLRNMIEAQVDLGLIRQALMDGAERSWALPFRFVTAAKHAPSLADALNEAMLRAIQPEPNLPGMTYIILDVSGSMDDVLSAKSTMCRWEAASALGVSRSTVTRWADDGRLRVVGPRNARRVPRSEIQRLAR